MSDENEDLLNVVKNRRAMIESADRELKSKMSIPQIEPIVQENTVINTDEIAVEIKNEESVSEEQDVQSDEIVTVSTTIDDSVIVEQSEIPIVINQNINNDVIAVTEPIIVEYNDTDVSKSETSID